jgi:hypothetical protein
MEAEADAIAQTQLSEVPSVEQWRSFASTPWGLTPFGLTQFKNIEGGKPFSECVFCGKTFKGNNARTKI